MAQNSNFLSRINDKIKYMDETTGDLKTRTGSILLKKPINIKEQTAIKNGKTYNGNASSTAKATVNEILVGYFCKPGTKADPFACYKKQKAKVTKDFTTNAKSMSVHEYLNEVGHAAVMASLFLNYAVKGGKTRPKVQYAPQSVLTSSAGVEQCYWTAQGNEMTQIFGKTIATKGSTGNPTDTLVRFKYDGVDTYLGLSAKATIKYGEIPFTNPGVGTVSEEMFSGLKLHPDPKENKKLIRGKLSSLYASVERSMLRYCEKNTSTWAKAHGGRGLDYHANRLYGKLWSDASLSREHQGYVLKYLQQNAALSKPAKTTKKETNSKLIAENAALYKKIVDYGHQAIEKLRDRFLDMIVTMDSEERTIWLLGFVGAKYEGPDYIKATGMGDYKSSSWIGFRATLDEPRANKKIKGIKAPHVWLEPFDGSTGIRVYGPGPNDHIFSMRFKWASRPFVTAMKMSGDPGYQIEQYHEDPPGVLRGTKAKKKI